MVADLHLGRTKKLLRLADLEEGRTGELRHDFRERYGVCYDEVEPDEALDLIAQLPAGSHYRGSIDEGARWTNTDYFLAEIVDTLHMVLFRLGGYREGVVPSMVVRPGDARKAAEDEARLDEAARSDRRRRDSVMGRINGTRWEEAV